MMKIAGSGSESISQRHGSADPDPPQNVMDPQHCPEHQKIVISPACSVADPGCLSQIPDPVFYPSRIPDPDSSKREG
jgi:hypothetical protein